MVIYHPHAILEYLPVATNWHTLHVVCALMHERGFWGAASARAPAAAAAAAAAAASPGATLAGPGREASRRAWAVAVRSAPLARVGARRGRMA